MAAAGGQLKLLVKKLSEAAVLPTRSSAEAAGAYDGVVPARGKALLKTDLAAIIPSGCYGRIDADYRGNIGVILFNLSDSDFAVKAGDRIAQLILERIAVAEVEEVAELPASDRGAGGFGSTGVSGAAKKARTE